MMGSSIPNRSLREQLAKEDRSLTTRLWLATLAPIAFGIAIVVVSVKQTRSLNADITEKRAHLAQLDSQIAKDSSTIAKGRQSIKNLTPVALRAYGWQPDSLLRALAHDTTVVVQSIQANDELHHVLALEPSPPSREQVLYFAKDTIVDPHQRVFIAALRGLGFPVSVAKPRRPDLPTNIVWFGSAVKIDDVKLVAYSLIRAGYRVQQIAEFRNPGGAHIDRISIGANWHVRCDPPLTVAQIRDRTSFPRDTTPTVENGTSNACP
jgi:hypothetical protein